MTLKYIPLVDLPDFLEGHRERRNKIVTVIGCFDLLHPGHISLIRKAKQLGDCLVVGVASDPTVKNLKGTSRPFIDGFSRVEMLAALTDVDFVTFYEDPFEFLSMVQPHIHVKGQDYRTKVIREEEYFSDLSGLLVIVQSDLRYTTSSLIEKAKADE